ncbi:MAG: hypothetical protein KF758_02140 [Anaerolineales bacterium]|nr:hypothetical protein [Anaerolineales bacterium]
MLYGLGPIAEQTSEWNYVLNDGVNIPRQLTDMNSEVTMFVRYNPCPLAKERLGMLREGKPIETNTPVYLSTCLPVYFP